MASPLPSWIFTFGYGHYHPVTGDELHHLFVRIAAVDASAARAEMVERFGIKWAFQYASEAEAGVEQFGLVELGQHEAHVAALKRRQGYCAPGEPVPQGTGAPVPLTVHVLHEGRALCGKPGVPGDWEPGHKWVYRDHDGGGPRTAINCGLCLARFVAWCAQATDPFAAHQIDPPTSRAEHDQCVLAELEVIPDGTLQSWIDRSFTTVSALAQAELARRRFARANPSAPPVHGPADAEALIARADRGQGRHSVKLVVDHMRAAHHAEVEELLARLAREQPPTE